MHSATDMIAGWLARARLGPIPDGPAGRRQRRRWSWQQALRVRTGGTELEGRAFNVSAHGLGVLLPEALGVGTTVEISEADDTCCVAARVVYVHPADEPDGYRTGLRFLSADMGAKDTNVPDAT